MELNELKCLLTEISELSGIPEREATIFSIGARGHFENPATDVLAFFLDNNAEHNLGELALEALLISIGDGLSDQLSASLINAPKREVLTDGRNRIDLLLESDDWVLVLENKIFHEQINPFDDYEKFAEQKFAEKKRVHVVLSPSGQAPHGWYGVSYTSLIGTLKSGLAAHFISQPMNKWVVLLREFIVHMEQLMTEGTRVPAETYRYVLSHLEEIESAQKLKDTVIKELFSECAAVLQEALPEREIRANLHHWGLSPVLRFKVADWVGETEVVIFFGGANNYVTQTYIDHLVSEEQHSEARKAIETSGVLDKWPEKSGSMSVFKKPVLSLDKEAIFEEITERMLQVDYFEREVRTQF
ncbi:PD-(D/E)XK nuclease family protein [Marinomonas gallaica]|uniref:PD-(D/E)XK nuclease family protein n=1 Tax=Marinomonas gallaica TaxID=1806667 RepID=UPI003CE52D84